MKRSIKNKYAMYKSCASTLESHRELWDSIPGISSQVEKFNEQLLKIDELIRDLGESTRLTTMIKHQTLDELTDKSIVLKGILTAFAHDAGDQELMNSMEFPLAEIRAGAIVTRLRSISRIAKTGRELLDQISNWNWSEAQQSEIEELIIKARTEMPSPKLKRDELKIKRLELDSSVKELDTLLNNALDGLILGFKEEQIDFYNKWSSAREIIDYRSVRIKKDDIIDPESDSLEQGFE